MSHIVAVPIPAQRVPLTDAEGKITSTWFYWLKQGVSGVTDEVIETQDAQAVINDDLAILTAFEAAG